ncbi:MAG: flagellin [Halobacteriales archaeon]
MGFSVSGSLAIVVVGALIALSMTYTAGANGFERVTDARNDRADRVVERHNAGLEIANATYFDGNGTLRVTVNNTGTTSLSVNATDLLADNTYLANGTRTVAGNADTDLWLPGEQLTIEVSLPSRPDAVTVAIERGLADREVV